METGSDTTKILEKGPEYFRKQMELESETKGGMSAVERLAASKLKYVKSQQVAHTTQESLISLGSASVSSTESSKRSSNRGEKLVTVSHPKEATIGACSPGQIRRCSSKKRPDSLLLYRQKCDLLKGAAGRKHYAARRRLVNKNVPLVKVGDEECENEDTTPEETAKECSPHGAASQSEGKKNGSAERVTESRGPRSKVTLGLLAVPEFERRAGKGVSRSHSDISSRYSKNFADFDAFFMYCGLEGEVIESLGRENFSARSDEISLNIRSISVSTDDGFSRSSGDSDGLQEEKLHGNLHQGTSVIERNARIIKWLYSCRNALESGKKLRDLD
ncbi:protein FAM110C [Solea solea]|uniref:protein FAM110C n=1 Tax=Solea solea TaxID=90069 RepID=UPI00272AE97E|nr:protein FAM110C [Solea solea]